MPNKNRNPLFFGMLRIAMVWITSATLSFAAGGNRPDGCAELDQTQSAGGQPEETRSLKLGRAVGVDRTFEISYDFYGIPDRMVVVYNGSGDKKQTLDTGVVSNRGTQKFTIPAGSTPLVQITMNPGNGLSGTAWVYTPTETTENTATEIKLANIRWPKEQDWRNTIGRNESAEQAVTLEPPPKDATPANNFYRKVYYFEVPADTTCLRVSAVGTGPGEDNQHNGANPASIVVSKHCPPVGILPTKESEVLGNKKWRNTVIKLPENVGGSLAGKWYVTVFKKPTSRNPSSGGTLRIDCIKGGKWRKAEFAENDDERSRIAVGIEGGAIPTSGRMLLLSHGRVDSPLGNMNTLGAALSAKWNNRVAFHVNWSEGSFWNGKNTSSLIGSRLIVPAAKEIAPLVKNASIDFFGHSWGTYMGNEIAKINGNNFQRFFALDPAYEGFGTSFVGLDYPTGTINFSKRASYSMAIFGNGRYGSANLAARANDSILLQPSNDDNLAYKNSPNPVNLARHSEPVLLMTKFVSGKGIGSKQVEFSLGALGADTKMRPWKDVRKFEDDFQVEIHTDGAGVASKMVYYVERKGVAGFFFDKKIEITK